MIYIYITNKELSAEESSSKEGGGLLGYKLVVNPNHSQSRYGVLERIEEIWDTLVKDYDV